MTRKTYHLVLFSFLLLSLHACVSQQNETVSVDSNELIQLCVNKVQTTLQSLDDSISYPRNILNGETEWITVDMHDWCSGFWPGILWYAYEASEDSTLLAQAQRYSDPLIGVLEVPVDNHDLGFMLYNSFGNGYRLTGDTSYAKILVRAADSLMTLFNPKVGTILSWPAMRGKMNWPHNTIIDNMINLELLFWATRYTDDSTYYKAAVSHAEVCMKTLVRPDFTTYHVAVFDTIDGHFIKGVTHQGYADQSLWARGQAWGIYGYTMCYRETGKIEFLETAQKLSDQFMNRLPEDGIPYWDFNDPAIPHAPKDASAAAVAASGMLELSYYIVDDRFHRKYLDTAKTLLQKLSTDTYLSTEQNNAFLLHSTGHHPHGSEIDASIIYADYYYLEALTRLQKIEKEYN